MRELAKPVPGFVGPVFLSAVAGLFRYRGVPIGEASVRQIPASLSTLSGALVGPQVTIGGFLATPGFAGLMPGYIGLYQINVAIPAAAASGVVDVTVHSNGVTSNTAKLPVR